MSYPAYEDLPRPRAHPYGNPLPCHFCPIKTTDMYLFQGKNICMRCNEKLIKRVELIIKFE